MAELTVTAPPCGTPMRLDLVAVAWLAEAALDNLWIGAQDPDHPGCCPRCCASCAAIRQLLDAGQLDQLVRHAPAAQQSTWWITDHLGRGGVDRDWLAACWAVPCDQCDDTKETR